MRVPNPHLSLVLQSAAVAIVARTDTARAGDTPTIVPTSDAGAPVDRPGAPALPPLTSTTPPAAPVESPALLAPPPSSVPAIHVGARLRAAGRYYSVNGGPIASAVDSTYGELRANGQIYAHASFTLSLYAGGVTGPVGIEDAMIGFDFANPAHLWIGQMLVPVDRANLGGPFNSIPWNFYPGLLAYGATIRVVALPHENSIGRDGGGVLWGDLAGKKSHYALGVFLPTPPNAQPVPPQTPLLSARISVDILGQENGYLVKSSYFGEQDIVAIGVGGQFQKDGSVGVAPTGTTGVPIGSVPPSDDYAELNSDALVEMRYGGGGFFTLDGAYYHYVGNNEPIQDEVSLLGAIATPELGIGNLQPYGRWQWFSPRANSVDVETFAVDAGLNYLIMGPALRIMLAYEHVDLGNHKLSDVGQLGAQAIFY
jgi:hypothetical protein